MKRLLTAALALGLALLAPAAQADTFSFEVTDPKDLAGIDAAKDAYNASLPDQYETVVVEPESKDAQGNVIPAKTEQRAIVPKPGILTREQYVRFVAGKAIESYRKQYGLWP